MGFYQARRGVARGCSHMRLRKLARFLVGAYFLMANRRRGQPADRPACRWFCTAPSTQSGSTMVRGLTTARGSRQELADATRDDLHRTHIALLAQSRSIVVREAIAKRDDVPFGVQAALSNDDADAVRAAIAANPRAAVSVMHHLAADPHHGVLLSLASNPSIPREIAEGLASHNRADVRNAAIRRLEMREVPAAPVIRDPDAHIPELRDRVAQAPEPVSDARPWLFGEEIDYPVGATLSLLAQHVSASQLLAPYRDHIPSSLSQLGVATAS